MKAITVELFIYSLLGADNGKIVLDKMDTNIRNGLVYFTHFIKKLDDLKYDNIIPHFIGMQNFNIMYHAQQFYLFNSV
jgi:hypothetical protein